MPGFGRDGISSLPPAGWYQDPSCQSVVRYWDGNSWSRDQVRTASASSAVSVTSPANPNPGSWRPVTAQSGAAINGTSVPPEAPPPSRPARTRGRRLGWGIALAVALLAAGAAGVLTLLTVWPGTASSPAEQYVELANRSDATEAPIQRDLNAGIASGPNPARYRRDLQAFAVSYRNFDRALAKLRLTGRAAGDAIVLIATQEMIARGFDQIAAAPDCACSVAAEIGPFQSIRIAAIAHLRADLGLAPAPTLAPPLKATAPAPAA